MKISLKILMVSVLINIVNINSSYCMEYGNEAQMLCKTESKEKSGIASDLVKEICHPYYKLKNKTERKVLAKKFYDFLFGNNLQNFKTILSGKCNNENWMECYTSECADKVCKCAWNKALFEISNFLTNESIHSYLVTFIMEDDISDNILQTINKNNINDPNVKSITENIRCIIFNAQLGMHSSFGTICRHYDETNDKQEKEKPTQEFYDGLFGNNGNNLNTILFGNYCESELCRVHDMLNREDVHDYIRNFLLVKNNNSLIENISNIVETTNTKSNDYYIIRNIKDELKNCIDIAKLFKQLGTSSTFHKIYFDYIRAKKVKDKQSQEKIAIEFFNVLFGNGGENLNTILSHNFKGKIPAYPFEINYNRHYDESSYIKFMLYETNKDMISYFNSFSIEDQTHFFNNILQIINKKTNYNDNENILAIKDTIKCAIHDIQHSRYFKIWKWWINYPRPIP